MEQCERAETTNNISGAKFAASDEDSDNKRKKKRSKFKERDEYGKKHHKNNLRFIALYMVKTKATRPGSANYSRKGIKTSLSIQQRTTRGITEK